VAVWHAEIIHRGGSPHCRPPSRTLHFGHWLVKVTRTGAVIERHAEDCGSGIVLEIRVESHGPSLLRTAWPRFEPLWPRQGATSCERQGHCRTNADRDRARGSASRRHGGSLGVAPGRPKPRKPPGNLPRNKMVRHPAGLRLAAEWANHHSAPGASPGAAAASAGASSRRLAGCGPNGSRHADVEQFGVVAVGHFNGLGSHGCWQEHAGAGNEIGQPPS
jgi:hypothetical protein